MYTNTDKTIKELRKLLIEAKDIPIVEMLKFLSFIAILLGLIVLAAVSVFWGFGHFIL